MQIRHNTLHLFIFVNTVQTATRRPVSVHILSCLPIKPLYVIFLATSFTQICSRIQTLANCDNCLQYTVHNTLRTITSTWCSDNWSCSLLATQHWTPKWTSCNNRLTWYFSWEFAVGSEWSCSFNREYNTCTWSSSSWRHRRSTGCDMSGRQLNLVIGYVCRCHPLWCIFQAIFQRCTDFSLSCMLESTQNASWN